jgi:hydroxymethylglutaryl-CoA lyase
LRAIVKLARNAGLNVVAYISMAFGNPYGEVWNISDVVAACDQLIGEGVRQISLADTVGMAAPELIAETVATVLSEYDDLEFGVHLHSRRGEAGARIRAAYEAGCRRFDSAIGGLGGCPFAQDVLVGNIPTEMLIPTLKECGARLPELGSLDDLLRANMEIVAGAGVLAK